MLGAMLLMMQSAPLDPAAPPASGPVLPRLIAATPRCAPSNDDIVICGDNDPEQYRLRPLGPPPNGKPLPPMTAKLGNGTIDGRAQERCVGGFCAPAAMATFKTSF